MIHMRDLLREPVGSAQASRLKIIKELMARPGTQSDLVRRSGFSLGTVNAIVRELGDERLIEQTGERRNNRVVRLRELTGVAVGIELGYRNTIVVGRAAHAPFEEARRTALSVGAARGARGWLDSTLRAVHEVVADVGEHEDDIGTVGMAIPRMVDPVDQSLTPPLLPPWRGAENPASRLTRALREHADHRGVDVGALQVRLDNDATLGALAESVYGDHRAETLVFVKASTGVGAGVVIEGRLRRGFRGGAGELGHMMIQPRGRFCTCGGRGCLETLIGGDALLANARAVLGNEEFASPKSVNELVAKAREGDPICSRVVHEAGMQLGYAVGTLCNLLNPDVVVLGGALGNAGEMVLDPCMSGIRRSALRAAHESHFRLVSSTLSDGTAHGALLMGIEGEGTLRGQRSPM